MMYNSKQEALEEIFLVEGINNLLPITIGKLIITFDLMLKALAKESYTLSNELGISPASAVTLTHKLWPDKPSSNIKVCTWLLSKYDLKYCSSCNLVRTTDGFSKNSSRATGYNSHCKDCYKENTRAYHREYQKTRKLLKLSRVPSWADLNKIKDIYNNCPEGYHVDHIIPLQGKLVSGLHIDTNLQYLPAVDNLIKGNKFTV